MKVTPARRIAYRVLGAVRERDGYAPEILDAVLKETDLERPDVAHATRLAYGTLQTSGTLDGVIDRHARTPSRIEGPVRDILRVAVYELLFGDGAEHAAVHQAVEAVRQIRPRATGMANAILRRVSEEAPGFPWGDPTVDDEALTRESAHPAWLARMLRDELGIETARAVMAANNEPAPLFLRHNPYKGELGPGLEMLDTDGAGPESCDLPGCVRVATPAAAVNGRALAEGLFVVSDAAAQFATVAVDPRPDGTVVEIGAGRGTKSVGLQALAGSRGGPANIIAVDIHAHKIATLLDRMDALSVPGVTGVVADARALEGAEGVPPRGSADVVLVDAPCSGLGALRRHPMKRWRITEQDLSRLAVLQAELLGSAASLVRPGGAIVYSTCTIVRIENHDVVRGFLESDVGRGFQTVTLAPLVPRSWERWMTPEGWLSSLPSVGGPEGHFVARLERTDR